MVVYMWNFLKGLALARTVAIDRPGRFGRMLEISCPVGSLLLLFQCCSMMRVSTAVHVRLPAAKDHTDSEKSPRSLIRLMVHVAKPGIPGPW